MGFTHTFLQETEQLYFCTFYSPLFLPNTGLCTWTVRIQDQCEVAGHLAVALDGFGSIDKLLNIFEPVFPIFLKDAGPTLKNGPSLPAFFLVPGARLPSTLRRLGQMHIALTRGQLHWGRLITTNLQFPLHEGDERPCKDIK